MSKELNIKNRKAYFEYEIKDKYVAGMQLTGTEIKSIRDGKATIAEAYCTFRKDELYVKNMHISEYEKTSARANHDPIRLRKLLLNRKELDKLQAAVKEKGQTIIPLKVFLSERGFAKLEIGLAQGKKLHDKRQSIKEKDTKREIDRAMKGRY